jgi:signal transduction histidine kinase
MSLLKSVQRKKYRMKKVFEKVKADKRIIIGYSTSLFLLLVTYVVTMIANNQLKDSTATVEHTYKLISALEVLLSKLKDAETGVRGYALTRDINFLQPYDNSKTDCDSIYKKIVILTKDNPVQQYRLLDLKKAMKRRFEIFIAAIVYYKNGATDPDYELREIQLEAKREMDKLRLTVAIMQDEEKQQLAKRDNDLKSIFNTINSITIISLVLTVMLVVIGFITYTNENKGRITAMNNLEENQQQLSNRVNELNEANIELKQMRSLEKFAATGRIARTIAHEVRNPLTNINLATSQLKTDIPAPDENMLYLFGIIDRNSNRINKLISDLLNSTKFTELRFTTALVNDILDDSLRMAKDRIELNQITIKKNYTTKCKLNIDTEKIKIPFLNIIINAIEAMEPGKGILEITTKEEGGKCVIIINDNGIGMDAEELSKVFEPYFSNKPKGHGLGLTNTQNIIFNHQGTISVESEAGKGSTFIIKLIVA